MYHNVSLWTIYICGISNVVYMLFAEIKTQQFMSIETFYELNIFLCYFSEQNAKWLRTAHASLRSSSINIE